MHSFQRSLLLLVIAASSFPSREARADVDAATAPPVHWKADPLFPGAHRVSLGVGTGVPFVGMGEVTYAPSEHVAIGGLFGATPYLLGAGLRPRVGLPLSARTRLTLVSPLILYPSGEGTFGNAPPWFLAQPALRLERRVGDSGYLHVNAGIVGAVGFPTKESATYNGRAVSHGTTWGVWNTVGVGGAVSVSEHTLVFADAMLVMEGARLAGEHWFGGPPFVFTVGVQRTL